MDMTDKFIMSEKKNMLKEIGRRSRAFMDYMQAVYEMPGPGAFKPGAKSVDDLPNSEDIIVCLTLAQLTDLTAAFSYLAQDGNTIERCALILKALQAAYKDMQENPSHGYKYPMSYRLVDEVTPHQPEPQHGPQNNE